MTMRFKGYTWQVNPTSLQVACARSVKETPLPFAGGLTVDLGLKKRRVSGEGYFVGADCMDQWRRREEVLGQEGPELVRYSFSFAEHRAGERWQGQGRHLALAGESLWDYAGRYGWDMEALRKANLHIRDIAELSQGEEVFSP